MDRVITINNWWDGPLTGLAYFDGQVCIYERIFDEITDDYTDEYYLTPVSDTEKDEITEEWREWCDAVSGEDLELFYRSHMNDRAIDKVLSNSASKRKYRKKAKFCGEKAEGFIPVDYYAEWYD